MSLSKWFHHDSSDYPKPGEALTPEQKNHWMKILIKYAEYVGVAGDQVAIVRKVIVSKMSDGTAKKVMIAAADSLAKGYLKAYDMFKKEYDTAEAGKMPDFSSGIDFPPPPPAVPKDPNADGLSYFQLEWDSISHCLNAVATKSEKFAEFVPIITAAGDEFVNDLSKFFGHPQKSKEPEVPPLQPPEQQPATIASESDNA